MTTEANSATPAGWTAHTAAVGGGEISYLKGGGGPSVLVLPRDTGHAPRQEFLDLLAAHSTVYYPFLPGFHGGDPAGWEWLGNVRDMAVVLRQFVDGLNAGKMSLVGLGFGGWIAAEMATMAGSALDALVLVAPMGIQPKSGQIYDQFLVSTEAYARQSFANQDLFDAIYTAEPGFAQLESWETDREMTSRLAWKPYMYNYTLPGLLRGLGTPTLIAWGDTDEVVPLECGDLYRAALPNAKLEIISRAGHALDLEQPDALAAKVAAFLQTTRTR